MKRDEFHYQWALPERLDVPPDQLQARLDFYHDTTVLYLLENHVITTRVVSARDIALAFLREVPLGSGLLPENALWWRQGRNGIEIGLWEPSRIWPVALQTDPLQPPRRFKLPMPGLIFVCYPAQAPKVYAVKKRPRSENEAIYHAPLFNVFHDGRTCTGTHRYPESIDEIPESFFRSFFSPTADHSNRSRAYPHDLVHLWEMLDGRKRYPLGDLVRYGQLKEIM